MTLIRFDAREMDRAMEHAGGARALSIPMDAYRRANDIWMHFDVPGVSEDAIDLTVEQNALTLEVGRRWTEHEGDRILAHERPQGVFRRQLLLAESLDVNAMEATLRNGVLTVRIPVEESARPHRVPIRATGGEAVEVEARSPS